MSLLDSITGFHIEPTNICTLKCEGCARTRFIQQWPQHWKNHSLDIASVVRFLDIDLADKTIELGGNYGDPIYHPEFFDFVKQFKQKGSRLKITTNGSYKSKSWWQQLADLLDASDIVQFSIDGVPDNFTDYRTNADWPSIKEGIEVLTRSKSATVWKYIVFAFNQDHIEMARQISQELGMSEFKLETSDRFDEQTQHLKPQDTQFLGQRMTWADSWRQQPTQVEIDAKCKNHREHYISADGFYSPCCYTADHRFYYKTKFGKNKKMFDITKSTLSQILDHEEVRSWFQNLQDQPVCQFNCPKINSSV